MYLMYRPYKTGDEQQIVELHKSTFGSDASLTQWQWQFRDNPSGMIFIWLAFYGEQCVGQYSLLPISVVRNGKPVLALQSLSSMVHPDFQRKGILTSLEELAREDTPKGTPLFTFLNENSLPVYTKRLGWRLLGSPPTFMKPLGLKNFAKTRPWALAGHPLFLLYREPWHLGRPKLNLLQFEHYDEEIEALWNDACLDYPLTVDRSRDWFQWRYFLKNRSYSKYKIYQNNDLLGFIVVRFQERFGLSFCWVMDIVLNESQMLPAALLAMEKQVQSRCDFVSLLLPNKALASSLHRAGYLTLPNRLQPHRFYFCVKTNQYECPEWEDFHAWHFSWSMHDVL